MSELIERTVATPAGKARVWEKGKGRKTAPPVVFFAGLGGMPAWLPMLDTLAAKQRVVVPSLPGFPGGANHELLDEHLDWILTAIDLVEQSANGVGVNLVGASVGGALAAEVAALRPDLVKRLVLIAPYGIFDPKEPIADVFAQTPGTQAKVLSTKSDAYEAYRARPNSVDELEWTILQLRAEMAAARILWPIGDTRLAKRLSRIHQPTLILWGAEDKVIPPSYAKTFAKGIKGKTKVKTIRGAGHKAEFDSPDAVAKAIAEFLG